jgi:anti-sigma B factor antagonist
VRWMGRQAVVPVPEHLDVSNAGQFSERLLVLINRGAAELVVDMTVMVSCDYAGADAVVRAYQRAAANGTQLRLVVTAAIVRRVLTVNGLDRLIPVYPSLEAAAAAAAPSGVVSLPVDRAPDGQAGPARAVPVRHQPGGGWGAGRAGKCGDHAAVLCGLIDPVRGKMHTKHPRRSPLRHPKRA